MDGPTAAVICSAVLSTGGAIVVALVKFVPPRRTQATTDSEDRCHRRMAGLETRLAVVETNYQNFGRSFDELRKEIHEMRQEVRMLAGRHRETE